MYFNGIGTQQNYNEGFSWFKKAADAGIPDAICQVGMFYHSGLIVEKNQAEAFTYFKKAAELGFAEAQNLLGLYYENGIHVNKDVTQARLWFEMAAKKDDAMALYNLGRFYEQGKGGLMRDVKEAGRLFEKSANLGCYPAQKLLAEGYRKGLVGLPINLAKANFWEQKAANNKDRGVMVSP